MESVVRQEMFLFVCFLHEIHVVLVEHIIFILLCEMFSEISVSNINIITLLQSAYDLLYLASMQLLQGLFGFQLFS